MSQYPSPYSPPPYPATFDYYAATGGDPLAPGKRAGLTLIILGSLALLFGFCIEAFFSLIPIDQMLAQGGMPPGALNGMSPDQAKRQMLIAGGVLVAFGLLMATLGPFVRRGNRGATIASVVVGGLALVVLALDILGALFMAMTNPNPSIVMGLCVIMVPTILLALTMVWLIQALRAGSAVRLFQDQQRYQAQYWYSQQQQQFPGYPPAGYAPPTPYPPQQAWAPPPGQPTWAPPPPPPPARQEPPTQSTPPEEKQ